MDDEPLSVEELAEPEDGWADFIRLGCPDDARPDMYVQHEDSPAPAADLEFIAAARNCVPRLIAEVRERRGCSE